MGNATSVYVLERYRRFYPTVKQEIENGNIDSRVRYFVGLCRRTQLLGINYNCLLRLSLTEFPPGIGVLGRGWVDIIACGQCCW